MKLLHKSLNRRVKVPTILQMEAVECGAASLAMILSYFGRYVTLEEMRIACGVSRDGSKASNILRAGKQYGLEVKAYRKEPVDLRRMPLPMIIHWNFNHFLVLEGFRNGKVFLKDPAVGASVVSEEEFDQAFTGVVITFTKDVDFQKSGRMPSIWRSLLEKLKGSELAVLFLAFTGLALVIPGFVIPMFSTIYLDDVLLSNKSDWMLPLLAAMCVTALLRGVLTWIREYCLLRLQMKISVIGSGRFLWHVLRMPMNFFSQRYTGDITSRMASNNTVASAVAGQLTSSVINIFLLIFYVVVMLQYNVLLTLLAVISAVFQMLYLRKISKERKDKNKKLMQDQGKLLGTSMSGLKTIENLKATGSEGDFFTMWSGYQAKVTKATQDMDISTAYLTTVPTLILTVTTTAVLMIGGYEILDGDMTVGLLVAFQSLMSSFFEPVNSLMNLGSTIQNLESDIGRLEDVLNYPEDSILENETIELEKSGFVRKLEGSIEVTDLTFGYSILEDPLIKDFSLKLTPGSRVALVGGSGCGKSTIAKLIAGILTPWSGEILFDGKPRKEIPRNVLCRSLSMVDQDICMISGTIKDNITLWDNNISEPEVIKATTDALIHDDITNRTGGYANIMEEGGKNLSGGQKQRLEIARAFVNNPSILILDEATSALDVNTEQQLDNNIRKRGCTCIIVAHRLSTIRDCDEIIVLNKGEIVQRGTHELLMQEKGYYADLINAY
ncbi:MAG: bacteriocin system transporter, peptidase/ATP-binding protein [Lachnospiraceae bacterium]|nr:bacteriocin system transporter, peptidase/ATP-binding protein [Lachnospiraceae bacterium]